jgi:hypothetical protein
MKHAMLNKIDDPWISAFSLLPRSLVIDIAPDDLGVSAGFSKAGYCIHWGVLYNKEPQSLWKV